MVDEALAEKWSDNPDLIPQDCKKYFNSKGIDVNRLNAKHIAALRDGKNGLGYTWHEGENLFSGYLIKTEIHSQIPHLGGYSTIQSLATQNNLAQVRQDLYNTINWINGGR